MKTFINTIFIVVFITLLSGCNKTTETTANTLLDQAIEAHGSKNIYGKEISFNFRDWRYTLRRDSTHFQYTRQKDSIEDQLHSLGGFSRYINERKVEIADSMAAKYSSSVNSVLYFVQLPLVLTDHAVQKEYLDIVTIKEQNYHTLKVTFKEEGGGEDFEDEFRYWINTETLEIDYLAYSYLTDGGGVRFREAFGKEHIGDILFQNYRNFKPMDKETPLDSIIGLYENAKLQLLSTIENNNIRVGPLK